MNNAQHINQDSGDTEYYTPPAIIEAAREVMGWFDLDPASSEAANRVVKARSIFTAVDDGLKQRWHGKVWMNHPFSRRYNAAWIRKLIDSHLCGQVKEACCITYAATSERWFEPLLLHPQCFLLPRTNYLLPDGSIKRGVTKGSVVTYVGRDVQKFTEVFSRLGVVKVVV